MPSQLSPWLQFLQFLPCFILFIGVPTELPTALPTTTPTLPPSSKCNSTAQNVDPCHDYYFLSLSRPPASTNHTFSNSASAFPTNNPSEVVPNVVMIITDEHSFRTLGSYRRYYRERLNQPMQASTWGEENLVYTPNLDRLADEGALFSNFYTVTPLCTPSRASFMSGLMPAFTGESDLNHGRMDDDVITFAQILQDEKDFFTGCKFCFFTIQICKYPWLTAKLIIAIFILKRSWKISFKWRS